MEKILFEYPYFIFKEEYPEDSVLIRRQASIRPVNLSHEPYDIFLNNGVNSFHLIFGKYDDVQWNESSLQEAADFNGRIDYNDVSAICHALKSIQPYLS